MTYEGLPEYLRTAIRDREHVVPNYGGWEDDVFYLTGPTTAESHNALIEYDVGRDLLRCDYVASEFDFVCIWTPGHEGLHIPMREQDWAKFPVVVKEMYANGE